MNDKTKQKAREMAEKLSVDIDRCLYTNYGFAGSGTIIRMVDLIQPVLEQLLADKERLDWLDKCYDWQFRSAPSVFHWKEADKLVRTAIDNAMKEGK